MSASRTVTDPLHVLESKEMSPDEALKVGLCALIATGESGGHDRKVGRGKAGGVESAARRQVPKATGVCQVDVKVEQSRAPCEHCVRRSEAHHEEGDDECC